MCSREHDSARGPIFTPFSSNKIMPKQDFSFINPKDGYEMVRIPGGEFWMGAAENDSAAYGDEKPRHLHRVEPFYMGIYCLTVAQFRRFVRESGYDGGKYPGTGNGWDERWGYWQQDPDDHPVRFVNWFDAKAYGDWAGLRLPTEAEWEYAARGMEGFIYPWGDDWEEGRRVCWDEQQGPGGATAPVDAHPDGVSPFGLYQMSGNVYEWCADWYDQYSYKHFASGDFSPPKKCWGRVLRGGSWDSSYPRDLRHWYLDCLDPMYRRNGCGFRVARTV